MVELANAEQCVNELTDKGRLSGKATSVKLNVVACAIALHAGEKFASDSAAKLLFGVPRTTNVRGWVKLLAAMAEAGQAHGCAAGGSSSLQDPCLTGAERPSSLPGPSSTLTAREVTKKETQKEKKYRKARERYARNGRSDRPATGRKRGRPPMYGPKPRPWPPRPRRPRAWRQADGTWLLATWHIADSQGRWWC